MADSVNEEIYDRLIDNAAMSRLFENNVQIDVRRAVRKHKKKLRDISRVNPRSPQVRKEVKRFVKEVAVMTDGHLTEFGAEQLSFHTNNLHKSLGRVYKVRPPK